MDIQTFNTLKYLSTTKKKIIYTLYFQTDINIVYHHKSKPRKQDFAAAHTTTQT